MCDAGPLSSIAWANFLASGWFVQLAHSCYLSKSAKGVDNHLFMPFLTHWGQVTLKCISNLCPLLLSFLLLFFPLAHCYFLSCHFIHTATQMNWYFLSCYLFSYLPTVTFFPVTLFILLPKWTVTFFPVTFFSYLPTVTFFPVTLFIQVPQRTVTFFPVTFFPTCPLLLSFLLLFFLLVNCYFLSCYFFSCYFFSYLKLLLSFLLPFFLLLSFRAPVVLTENIILVLCLHKVTATHSTIEHLLMKSTGAWSPNELQRLDCMAGYQDSSSSNGSQGDMPYCCPSPFGSWPTGG